MKICPNCGTQVEEDVKFCTHCGYKFPVAQPVQAQNVNVNKPAEPQPQVQKQNSAPVQNQVPQQPQAQNQVTSQISNAVQNFDAHNLWQWFVNSWKHPVKKQKAEKWYGIVTFIVEDLLFIIATTVSANAAMSSATFGLFSGNSDTNGAFVQLFLYLLLLTLGSILASFIGSKFVYGNETDGWWEYTNRIAQISNLNAIFIVVAFLGGLIKSYTLYGMMSLLAAIFFSLAVFVPVLADKHAKRDKFYGLIIAVVIQIFVFMILTAIFGESISNQLQSSVTHLF